MAPGPELDPRQDISTREDLPDPPSYTDPDQLLGHTNDLRTTDLNLDSDWIDPSIDHQNLHSSVDQISEEVDKKKTEGGGATDEHSLGGGEDVINEKAQAEGSLIDLKAQPAAESEHIHPSESDSQHELLHRSDELAQENIDDQTKLNQLQENLKLGHEESEEQQSLEKGPELEITGSKVSEKLVKTESEPSQSLNPAEAEVLKRRDSSVPSVMEEEELAKPAAGSIEREEEVKPTVDSIKREEEEQDLGRKIEGSKDKTREVIDSKDEKAFKREADQSLDRPEQVSRISVEEWSDLSRTEVKAMMGMFLVPWLGILASLRSINQIWFLSFGTDLVLNRSLIGIGLGGFSLTVSILGPLSVYLSLIKLFVTVSDLVSQKIS
ncbi:hypothetical protein BY996DRAFT_936162 [Phakopsora pachyrhizi]|nr:hypothetical protein BY996DRAFT_936162 [Phakopsora pachyrhizi]